MLYSVNLLKQIHELFVTEKQSIMISAYNQRMPFVIFERVCCCIGQLSLNTIDDFRSRVSFYI